MDNIIKNKSELEFWIQADCMINHGKWKLSMMRRIANIIKGMYIDEYLIAMRKTLYYNHLKTNSNGLSKMLWGGVFILWKMLFDRIGVKLGFSIGYKCFSYGLVIPHYGTIVVGGDNRCGRYCVLHTSTCISGEHGGKRIGDALYLSSGAKINKPIHLGNNVQIASNSVVNKSFSEDNIVLAGMPATIKKTGNPTWYQGWEAEKRVAMIEERRK